MKVNVPGRGAVVMGIDEWARALEPADGKQKGGE